jgi:hypothetical protein
MNGLNQIHSQNETAARQEHQALIHAAIKQGHSVIVYRDEFGQPDLSRTPTVFPSQQALDTYIAGSVPLHLQGLLDVRYGATTPTPPQPTAPVTAPVTPSGHQPNGSGLQNHSVGGVYPFILVYRPFTNTWDVSHADGVTRASGIASYDEAYLHAEELRATATV